MGVPQEIRVKNPLTRSTGFLEAVCSHSLQPYVGCSFGRSLCGVGCYARHNRWITKGREWGSFLDVRVNTAEAYLDHVDSERRWGRKHRGGFAIFLSSSTDPFVPQEKKYGITQATLEAMTEAPPDALIVQTHSPTVANYGELLQTLGQVTDLRVHLSIESDRDHLPGLPKPASTFEARLHAAKTLHDRGLRVVITVAPLLPLERPTIFFQRIAEVCDAVVLDHFIQGDGTENGTRTKSTPLPDAMRRVEPRSVSLRYRDEMVALAQEVMPGRVGVHRDGFAGRFLP